MGNEAERFGQALTLLEAAPGVSVIRVSGLYRTEPQGDPDQAWFCNQVAALRCDKALTAADFLHLLLTVETKLGRVRHPDRRYGPRAIDLDLLLFGDIVCAQKGLCVPHPRLATRAFVLVPLLEIAPFLRFPDGRAPADCLAQLHYSVSGDSIRQKEQEKP